MPKTTPLFVGLDVHKETISLADAANGAKRRQGAALAQASGVTDETVGSTRLLDGTRTQTRIRRFSRETSAGMLFGITLKARAKRGRLILDEPTDLTEGTEVELLPLDPGDWLSDEDRSALRRVLVASSAEVAAGRTIGASEVLRELRSE